MSAKNGGVQTPPPPLVSQKSEIGLPPLPPLSEKIRNWLTPPPPLVRNHILTHSNYLVKPIFQEEITNFKINHSSSHDYEP